MFKNANLKLLPIVIELRINLEEKKKTKEKKKNEWFI